MNGLRTFAGRHTLATGLAAAALGVALFVYTVRQAGIEDIAAGLRSVGAGFLLIVAISAVREVARTYAWIVASDDGTLPFGAAFPARLIGEALGNLTPFGLLLSEPAKAALVRGVPFLAAFSALMIEHLLYAISVAIVIAAGMIAFLFAFPLPPGIRIASILALGSVALIAVVGVWLMVARPRLVTPFLAWIAGRGLGATFLLARLDRIRLVEGRIFGFYREYPRKVVALSLLLLLFHVAAVAEVYVALRLILDTAAVSMLSTFVLESVNRVITVAFKFVPFRLGVDEAGTGLVTGVLGFGTAVGVTLAIVRKARVLCWTGVGVLLLVRRGLSVRDVMKEVEAEGR